LRQAAEGMITSDLESTVKSRFYTFRCKQGPCKAAPQQSTKSLMYYDRNDSADKKDFIKLCKAKGGLTENLLLDEGNKDLKGKNPINSPHKDITITRIISQVELTNKATIEYKAEKDNKVIAALNTTLVPNAVHWCS
jgi:hypothetical protein